ncbi:RNB domain-containing ribonuclease [Streptomyces sp. NBC_00572]|uniref:RNB domain-containing ribonuclease n=1 Tax=Streptomyces sp. NBC_00572 TaxID=2903664 RepID=UPI0022551B69|nr:RNB domain-containing ribonuclease [Streptomyces sp. NBC_00572]MCX4985755.1 RNB domain-containing ribonuclease [Streptomyces sp. NBC_00572]
MRRRQMHMSREAQDDLLKALQQLRAELKASTEFPAHVLEAAEAAKAAVQLPAKDATHLPLFTIDPPTSKDLDQAMHLERRPGGGYRVHYAIADVAAFVRPGGPLDAEAHDRIETLYFPDLKVPLYPPSISEGPASLLPDQVVPALLWQHDLDADGNVTDSTVSRAKVRSLAKLNYKKVQQDIEAGTASESVALLREIGKLREAVEAARGGVAVNLPDQEVTLEDGSFRLSYVAALPVEGWNEQISLMTGMAAARIMLDSGTGILRTQKEQADPDVVRRVHDIAKLLGIDWKPGVSYAALVNSLDPADRKHMAFLSEATAMLLKAEYTTFRDHHIPKHTMHAAIAAPYTYCTAPLRRLIDRYTGELCVAACAGQAPPNWVLDALYCLPCDMARGKGKVADRRAVDLAEAAVLKNRVNEVFGGMVINTDAEIDEPKKGTVHLAEPAVMGRITSGVELDLGASVQAKLTRADPFFTGQHKILFNTV